MAALGRSCPAWDLLLTFVNSLVVACKLLLCFTHALCCSTHALPRDVGFSFPHQGSKCSLALQGGFLTTGPLGKPCLPLDYSVRPDSSPLITLSLLFSAAKSRSTFCGPVDCSMLGSSVLLYLPSLLKLMTIQLVISNHLILCHLSPFAFNLSQYQGLFQWIGSSHLVAKVLELQLQHQTSNKYSGLISFRIDWFDLFAVQGTLKSLLQQQIWKLQFFCTQPSLWSNSHIRTRLLEKL